MAAQLQREATAQVQEEVEVEEASQVRLLPAGDIKKAKDAGFYTCESLLMYSKKRLSEIKGLSEAKVEKILEAAKKSCKGFGIQTAKDYEAQRLREIVHISTGCAALDEILGGGIETKAITEIFGGAGKVAYIDTEGTFRPERIRPIAERFNLEAEAVLSNVVCARAHTLEQQVDFLLPLAAMMSEEPFKLLIMDSITANARTEFSGRGELAERQQKLGQLMARLRKIAEEYNVAVLITNQVVSDPSGGAMFVSDPKKPVGGHVIAHASTIRLSARKGKGEQRLLKVVDAPNLPEAEASYAISDQGVGDYKD
ncbi:hypothetical protein N2152v2_006430 [Parachlorella kessleri]